MSGYKCPYPSSGISNQLRIRSASTSVQSDWGSESLLSTWVKVFSINTQFSIEKIFFLSYITYREKVFQYWKNGFSLLKILGTFLSSVCRHEETLHPWLYKICPGKILIRLHECTDWSEPLLGSHVGMGVFWHCGWYMYAIVTKLYWGELFYAADFYMQCYRHNYSHSEFSLCRQRIAWQKEHKEPLMSESISIFKQGNLSHGQNA